MPDDDTFDIVCADCGKTFTYRAEDVSPLIRKTFVPNDEGAVTCPQCGTTLMVTYPPGFQWPK